LGIIIHLGRGQYCWGNRQSRQFTCKTGVVQLKCGFLGRCRTIGGREVALGGGLIHAGRIHFPAFPHVPCFSNAGCSKISRCGVIVYNGFGFNISIRPMLIIRR
jgi:hypothetical protein